MDSGDIVNKRFCTHCGHEQMPEEADDGVAVVGEAVGALCPLCLTPLVSALIEGETVCYCTQCRGILAETEAFSLIVSRRRAIHGANPNNIRTQPLDPGELKRALMCPNCNQRMETHPYFGGGNAVVDSCESCGLIWLDAGELAIIDHYAPHVPQFEPTLTPLGGRYQGGPRDMPL
jgi:Zn-finger nucleic acid-binding protein